MIDKPQPSVHLVFNGIGPHFTAEGILMNEVGIRPLARGADGGKVENIAHDLLPAVYVPILAAGTALAAFFRRSGGTRGLASPQAFGQVRSAKSMMPSASVITIAATTLT